MNPKILQILRKLVQLGIPVSKLVEAFPEFGTSLGAVGGTLGLVGGIQSGNVPGAVGSGLQLAGSAANLAGFPGVGDVTGALGGPLTFATGLANGDPISSTIGGVQTASLASGLLEGPTITSLLSSLYGALPGATTAAAGATGAAGTAAASGMAGSLATTAAAAPFAMMAMGGLHAAMTGGGDMFDAMFGTDYTGAYKKAIEKKNAPEAFTSALQKMAAGAGTLGQEGNLLDLLKTAQEGIGVRTNFGHNFDILKNSYGEDVSEIENAAPALSGANWKSWTQLMDRAAKEGVDINGLVGGSAESVGSGQYPAQQHPNPPNYRETWMDTGHSGQEGTLFTDPITGTNTPYAPAGTPGYTTAEANDISQAIYGMAMSQGKGFDGPLPGARGDGGYLAPDQLAELGLTPGNYEQGILDYLANMGSMGPAVAPPSQFQQVQEAYNDSPGGL